jgi:hypothetical protein
MASARRAVCLDPFGARIAIRIFKVVEAWRQRLQLLAEDDAPYAPQGGGGIVSIVFIGHHQLPLRVCRSNQPSLPSRTFMQRFTRFLTVLALTAASAVPALAATTFTDSTSFLATLAPGAYTNGFVPPTVNEQIASTFSFSGGGFAYTFSTSNPGATLSVGRRGNEQISNRAYFSDLTVTFTAGSPTAIGGEFFAVDSDGGFWPYDAVTVRLSDGTTTSFTPTSRSDAFRGFTSTTAITSLTMTASADYYLNAVDNLVVGQVAAVPEPGTWLMMSVGLAGLAFTRRRNVR